LCVWAARSDAELPTPTPLPTFTPPPTPAPTATPVRTPRPAVVRIAPPLASALVRDRACFTATVELPDGSTADATAAALWKVGTGTVAVPAGFVDGKKCFLAVGIGDTAISARDPATGLSSATTGGDATLVGEWPIYEIRVTPERVGMRLGTVRSLTATALLTGDRTRNVTQHVEWVSTDPLVAKAGNPSGNRSRIEALAKGQADVIARDPLSSVRGSAIVAVGALESLWVREPDAIFPGETTELTTIAYYEGGFSDELTEGVAYESSDPTIATADPDPGDKGVVTGLRPGHVTIDAIDLESGIRSGCCGTARVLGEVRRIDLDPPSLFMATRLHANPSPFRIGVTVLYAVPPDQLAGRSGAADRFKWLLDPTVAATDGVDDRGRMRVLPVGGGVTAITARDSATGITSSPLSMTVYERLDRIDVSTSEWEPSQLKERIIDVGYPTRYFAHGFFDGSRYVRLDDALFVASDPAIVTIGPYYMYGKSPGTTIISAVDAQTGLSSNEAGRNAVLQVRGALERIELVPRDVTMNIDQSQSLTAIGHYVGGVAEPVAQRLLFTSTDPEVVEAPNMEGNRSAIFTHSAGTAIISASDPVTGVRSTDSGDDVTVAVRDERLVRIDVSPASVALPLGGSRRFTATGHFTSGFTENLTQHVEWTSSEPFVAGTNNAPGDRSRVAAFGSGVATITATDLLTGISSTDSGDDATVTAGALTAITLAPATVTLTVGSALSFTTNGTLLGGTTINLTQDATYTSSDPAIAVATNQDGNRSRVVAMAPGTATLTAHRESAYQQAEDSNAVTVTVVEAE
jgi:hypothetical protein